MGFLSDFFFGSEPEIKTSTLPLTTPEQNVALNNLLKQLETPADQFTGGISGAENLSLSAMEDLAKERASGQGRTEAETAAIQKVTDILTADPQDIEGLLASFTANARDDFIRNVLPTLSRKNAGKFYSSEARKQEGEATRLFGQDLLQAREGLRYKSQSDQIKNALIAAGLIPQLEAGTISANQDILDALSLPRDVEFDKFAVNQRVKDLRINAILNALGIRTKENIVTSLPGSEGLIAGVAKGVATGYGSTLG